MINTLLFDFNGVLILDKPGYIATDLENKIYQKLGTSLNDQQDINNIILNLGWNEKHFWDYISKTWDAVIPNTELIEMIKELKKKGYKTALVSNTSGMIFRKNQEKFFGFNLETIFNELIISSEIKLVKPDIEIYEYALDKLDSSPRESVMIDDSSRYLRGASELGINTIQYTNNKNLFKEMLNLNIKK